MSSTHRRGLLVRRLAAVAAAIALPVSGLALALGAEERASAAELAMADQFDAAFSSQADAARASRPSPVDLLAPETASEISGSEAELDAEPAREIGTGGASYYGRKFAGKPTASGESFDPAKLTAAHRSLPFGSRVQVTNRRNGKSVVVRINDRGPFDHSRVIDLSRGAAERIGLIAQGHGTVKLALLGS